MLKELLPLLPSTRGEACFRLKILVRAYIDSFIILS